MPWAMSIGNLASRAVRDPVGVSQSAEDPLLPFEDMANGHPDEQAAFLWKADGHYEADLDLNLLAETSARSDAPSGWVDYLNLLAGTPGLPANPAAWGGYDGRTPALGVYRPAAQEVAVMPGEPFKLEIGLHRNDGGAVNARVRVVDAWSGKGWDGTTNAWTSDGVVATTSGGGWVDLTEEIAADAARAVRSVYHVIVEPASGDYSQPVYASAYAATGSPAFYAEADTVALIGHNLPTNATVSLGSESVTVTPVSCRASFTAKRLRTWHLDIQMPAGIQPRPMIGEVWIGKARYFTRNPNEGIGLSEGDPFQIRVEGAQGRVDILTDQALPAAAMRLELKTFTDAQFDQYRNQLARGSRFGAEPILLLPADEFDGTGRVFHGRIGPVVAYTVLRPGVRTFTVEFAESPFAGT